MTDVSQASVSHTRPAGNPAAPTSWVYFIQAGDDGPIKIGFTAGNPRDRLSALQTGNPVRLRLIGAVPGTLADENDLHQGFKEHRLEGEWFSPVPALLQFIKGAKWATRALEVPAPSPAGWEWHGDFTMRQQMDLMLLISELPRVKSELTTAMTTKSTHDLERIRKAVLLLREVVQANDWLIPEPRGMILRYLVDKTEAQAVGRDLLARLQEPLGVDPATFEDPDQDIPF